MVHLAKNGEMDKMARTELNEKVMISVESKQVLYSLKQPGERLGDVIERIIKTRKRNELVEHLDRIAREGNFVPLDSDPEFAQIKKGAVRAGQH